MIQFSDSVGVDDVSDARPKVYSPGARSMGRQAVCGPPTYPRRSRIGASPHHDDSATLFTSAKGRHEARCRRDSALGLTVRIW